MSKVSVGEFGKKWGTIIALAVALLVWILPTPEGMNITQHKVLAIFSGAIVLWITLSVSVATSIIIIVPLLYLWVGNPTGAMKDGVLVRQAGFALSGYGTAGLWMLVTGFIISIAMIETGIARRISLYILKLFGKTPFGATFAPMLANFVISPFTPSNTARTAAMLPIVEGIAQTYKAEKGTSNFGKLICIANALTSSITAGGFQTATIPNPIAIGMIVAAIGGATAQTSWAFWALAAVPTTLILLVGSVFVLHWLFPPEMKGIPGGLDYIDGELKKLGPVTTEERKALLYFALALLLWATDMLHHLNATMVAFVVSALILLPKIGVLTWKEAQKGIPWELFVYFGGVITLSNVLNNTKALAWVIQHLISSFGLQGTGIITLSIIMMGFSIFSHIIWSTTTAMAGVMIPIYIGIAQSFNFPIVAFVLPQAILMGYAFFLPFNTMGNIIFYGTGYFSVADLLKGGLAVGLLAWILWAITLVTWFPIIGLT
jgi:anion transporter